MEAVNSSEKSLTTTRYIPEGRGLDVHCRENAISNRFQTFELFLLHAHDICRTLPQLTSAILVQSVTFFSEVLKEYSFATLRETKDFFTP
jgi:hypothetical protein